MASFPDLRHRSRSAKAESTALRRFRSLKLLAVSAALLLTAFTAASELATLRGAKAHDASAYLTRELGPPLGSASLVRAPARMRPAVGGKLEIRRGGLRVTSGRHTLVLRFAASAAWRDFTNGVARETPFGRETITFGDNRVEQSLLVARHQGKKVWRWHLASNVHARVARDGSIKFGNSPLSILPVAIFDADGKNITPARLRWSLRGRTLELMLDDSELATPYIIDPVALVGACGPGIGDFAGCSVHAVNNKADLSSSPLLRPSSVNTGDLMIAAIATRNTDVINAPAGWTAIGNRRTQTTIEQALFYRFATVADTPTTTYTFSWTNNADSVAGLFAYSGVDSSTPFDVTPSDNSGSGTTATATGVTTTQNNDMLVAFYAAANNVTVTQNSGEGLTQEYSGLSGGGARLRGIGADGTQATAGASGNKTAAISNSNNWVAHLAALTPALSADGSGTMAASISNVSASQTGRTITFTYTAATNGMINGSVTLAVPAGWSAPSTTSNAAGYTTSSTGTVSVAGSTITVSNVTLSGGSTMTITYGNTGSGGPGATATSSTGAQTWQAQQKSKSSGTLTNLASSPSITVYAADGAGTIGASISVVSASQTGRTITFTYTAPAGGISSGSVSVAVPAGWSAPSTTSSAAGYSTSSAGTLAVAGSTITVSSLTLAAGNTFTITYGNTGSGGPGATATSTTGAQTWTTQEKSTSNGSLTNISSSPSITVYAADGSGTMAASISAVSASQTGRTITFTYTAPAGGISSGSVTVAVPAGWSAPSTTSSAAGYSTSSAGTLTVSGSTITVSSLTLAAGNTFTITYGNTGSGGPGATATSTTSAQTWTTQEKSTSSGSLTNISSSPSITVYAPDGSGTMAASISAVSASQTGRTITYTYTAPAGGISSGSVTVAVPAGWSPPSTTSSAAGYSTSSAGTLTVSGSTITVSSLTLAAGNTFTITYGDTGSGGPGATATSSTGAQTWTTQEKSTSNGSLASISSSPSITVYAADGSGTMSPSITAVSASQTGRTITFTYTAPAGGISNGSVTVAVASGWSAPSTTSSAAGYSTSSAGTLTVSGSTITVSSLTLAAGNTFTITYGDTGSGGPGAAATSSTGAQTWTTQEKSTSNGSLTNISSSPSITVYAADGSGTMAASISAVSASQTGRTITFTYTAPAGGISGASVTLAVPSGWSAPSTTSSAAGYSTSSAGTLTVSGSTITVSSLTLAAGNSFTITYGNTGSGGPGATAMSTTGAQTWTTQEKSTSAGSLTNISSSPSITVYAADGAGTLAADTSSVAVSSTGNTITFTYTAPAGGISSGSVTVAVPSGWSAPSTTGSAAGYSTSSAGTLTVSGSTITVSSLTLAAGNTFTIVYGSKASGGPGATATSSSGAQTWQAQEKSTSAGSLTNLSSSPSITVLASDGSGTLTTPTGAVNTSSTGNTITFTYTAATGGLANGSVTLAVPSGWSAPSTTGSAAGYTTASTGSVSVSSQTVTVSNITLSGGSTFTITYGSTASGGSGATAPSTAAAQAWQAQEKSSSGGTLTNLASSPAITVNDPTAPSAPSLTYGSFTNASVTGNTVYIRQGSAGGFTVTGTSSDPESGIDHLTFPGSLGSGWTGGGQDSSSPYTGVYTFSAAATAPAGNQDVTATNGWALTSAATPFTVAADTTAPSVTAPGVTAGYYTSLSVPVTKNGGSDGGSGVDNTTSVLQRDEIALTNGTCGTFPGTWSTTVTLSGGNDTSVASGKCYRYRELLSDKVGNQGASGASNTAKVDTSAPSTPTLAFSGLSGNAYYDGSGTLYIRPSAGGTFTVTAASSDGESAIGSYTFGTLNSNGGANFGGSQTGDHFDYTFNGTTTAPSTARSVSATNGAGTGSANATYSIAADTTAPSVTAPSVTSGYYTSLSVPVTKNGGSDGGSGIDATTSIVQRDDVTLSNGTCGGFAGSWSTVTLSGGNDTSVLSGHCYRYRELVSDRVGNQGTSGASNVARVDTQGPANSITLSNVSPAGSSLKVGTRVYYRGAVTGGGSFKLTNAVTDGEAGSASSATAALGGTTSGWSHTPSTVSTPAGGPYDSNSFGWSQGTTSSPTEVVTAADAAGNTTAASTLTFTNDSNAPTGGALTVNGGATWSTTGNFAIDTRTDYSETQSATESGLASSTLTRAAASLTNNSCGGYGSPTTIVGTPAQSLPTGCYLYTLTGTDNLGNTASVTATVKVDTSDPSAPTFSFSNFIGTTSSAGNTVFFLPTSTGSFDITASSSDGDSGIAGYTFPTAASFGTGWSVSGTGATRTYSYTPGSATPGTQNVSVSNNAGRTNSASFQVEVSDITPPTTSIQCNGAACAASYYSSAPVSVTLSADDGPTGSGVGVIRYTMDGSDPTPINGSDYVGAISIFTTTTVKFRAYDNLGNEEAVGSQLVRVDATAPTGQTIALTGADAPYFTSASVTFTTGNGSDADSGLDLSSATVTRETGNLSGDSCSGFSSDAGTFTSPDTAVSGAHCYRYTFTIADNVGHVSAPVTATAKVDMDNPSVTLADPGTPVAGVVGLSANASDPSTGVQQVVFQRSPAGASTWTTIGTDTSAPYTANWNTGAVADGLYDLRAVATDTLGHTTADVVASRRVDNTAPNTSIDSGPADPSNDATPTFTFSSSETGSTFQCRVDGGSWSSCTSPHTTAALGEGSHTFAVRATDAAGNTDATPASSTWTIDLTAPNTTIDSSPSNPSGNATPSFSFSSSETGSTFECRIDGGSWSSCASPFTTPALADGSHTFDVRATDTAGNMDATPASHTWTVDLTAPNTTIDSSPPSPSNDTTPTFSFSSSEGGSTFECRVDGGAWSTCTSPHTTAALAEGTHTFDVRATDAAGNTDASPASVTWAIDLTAPNTTIDSKPSNPSNDTTPTFTFSASEPGSTFECRIDGGSWSTCTSPHTTAALAEGSHTFDVRATDPAGNTDGTPASSTWTIDLTAPNTTIDSAPPALDNDTTPTFTFSSNEGGSTFECRVDGGSWSTCTSPHTTSALADGSHTFDVRATDPAGNTDATPASHMWSIDAGPPSVTITAPTTYVNSSDPSTYTVTATTPDGDVTKVNFYECSNASVGCSTGTWTQFDTDSSAPFTGSWTTPASDGKRAIRAVAVDAALNTGADIRTITIDRTAPSGVTVSYPNGYVTGSFAVTTTNGPDADVDASTARLERQTGNLSADSCSGYSGWTGASSPDSVATGHCAVYRYRLADNAGNWTTATSGNEVKSDTNAPTSSQDDPGANIRQTVSLTSSASDTGGSGLASVAFQRRPTGGGSWTTIGTDTTSPFSTSFDTTTVADGLYDFRTVATDVAGNAEASPVVVANRRIDNTAPSATMTSPGNPIRGTVTLTSSTGDGGSGLASVTYELAPNGGSFNTQPATWDTTLGADGLYDLRVTATDVAGNSTTSSLLTTRVDNTAPALTFSSPATGATVSGTVSLNATASDASPASPPISFFYKLHSDPPSAYTATSASWDTTSLPAGDGLYDLRARATDDASNTTTVENTSIRVDNVPPAVAITAPAPAINGSLPSPTSFSATASDTGGSGVQQVRFFECTDQSTNCSTGVWSPLGTVAAPGPYTVSWTIPGTDGNHALAAVATDNAGHSSSAIRNVDVDRTAPETTIVGKPADPSNAATPSFTFNSSETGSTFECRVDGGGWAPCTSPHSVSGLTDNSHTFDVRATDAAGNTDPSPDTWTWHRDTNNPNASINNPGANVRASITLTSAENDPPANGYASGLASVTFEYSADGTTWAPIGTNNSPPFNNMLWNTAAVADGVYQIRVVAHDVAGNSTASTPVTNVRIDNTPPTTSQNDPGQYLRATKTLTGSAADSGSGVDHVDFQRAPTGSGSWTTIATDSTPGDGFQVNFDTTAVADGHYDFRTVAYDIAGNQAASAPVTDRLVDNTAPNATLNDPGAYLRGAVGLSSSTSDPGGANASGIASVAYEYSPNGGTTWFPTGSTFDSTSVADGNVDLHVIATDAAGNTTASAPLTKLVDNTKPVTTDDAPSGWHASPVTVTLTPSDAGSGVNVTEYSVDGSATYTVGTSVVIPAPADGSNDGSHTIAYFSVDNAGNIESVKSATVLIDATPPACPSCSAADYLRGTVTLSASPAADGSGIKSVTFEYSPAGAGVWTTIGTDTTGPAPYTTGWDTTAVPDGHYDLRIRITDNADNVTTTSLPDKVVDNTAPNVATVGSPTEGQVVSGTVGIAASASDVTSPIASVQFLVRGSVLGTDTTAPFSMNWDSTSGPDGAATIQIVVTDMAGNSTTSAVRNVTVDNVAPTPTLADPGQNLSGTVSLSASSDADTIQVDFERRPAGGGSWTTIASDSTLPWGTSLDTTTLADGLYDFRAVATDGTGHTGVSPLRTNIRIDNAAPSGSITSPSAGATVGGNSVTLSASVADAGSGVASVRYELRPTGGGSFTQIATSSSAPFSATWDATTVSTGSYDLRPVITDRAGNTFTGPAVTFNVDVTAPTVTLTNPGATISGTVTLNATVSGSGATSVAFGISPAGGASWTSIGTDTSSPWSTAFDTTKVTDGVYDLRAKVSDSLGNTSEDVVANIRVDNTAPILVSSSPADGSTVGSANAISLVTNEPTTPVGVTLDGGATVAPVVSGTHIDYNTGALSAGPHTLAGELQDASGKRTPFRVHFTVGSTGYVEENTSSSGSSTVTSSDGFASATMPPGAWSTSGNDWIVLRIQPTAAPSGLTNGFAPGPEALEVTARWALSGVELHEFAQPIGILIRSTESGLVPATFENGAWRVIHRVPTAGTLPAGWTDGFFTDGNGVHVLTKHLSLFALLKDVQAPQSPQNVRGYLGASGLTIRWLPGSDNSGTYDYVTLFSGSSDAGHYGPDYTAASVAGWARGDQRIFRLKETDLAGNESDLTPPLVEIPSLIGLTPDEAEALLAKLGLSLGSVTVGGAGQPGTITGPEGLVLAPQGASIDVTVAPGGATATFAFKVVTAPKFKPARRKKLAARVTLTRTARVTAQLFSPRRARLYTWRVQVHAGQTILRLRIPRQVRRPGIYTMRWTARAGGEIRTRTIRIRVVGAKPPVQRVQIVLSGAAAMSAAGKVGKNQTIVDGVEPTFDATANRNRDVRVIVVDVDEFGVSIVRDLHAVFPSVKIVALAAGPRTMAAALRAGATVVLPRTTPPASLAKIIQRLAKR